MAEDTTTKQEYLAVVSEWSSVSTSGSRVGNAFPLFSFTRNEIVKDQDDEFPNFGAVFLVNRGERRVWEFVRLSVKINERYDSNHTRACYYITLAPPPAYEVVGGDCPIAAILDVPHFNVITSDNVIRNPAQNVTPAFFIRDEQHRLFGPLRRTHVAMNSADRIEAIHWAPWGAESTIFEFTEERLKAQGCKIVAYEHPSPPNEVVNRAFRFLAGPVLKLTSPRAHDRLPDDQLAEWYLKFRDISDISDATLKILRSAADKLDADAPEHVRRRCQRLSQLIGSLEALQGERHAIAQRFIESDDGQRLIDQRLAREVEARAQAIDAEVMHRKGDLAKERQKLAAELETLRANHARQIQRLKDDQTLLEAKLAAARDNLALLEATLLEKSERLAERLHEQIPLLAAMGGMRGFAAAAGNGTAANAPVAAPSFSGRVLWSEVTRPAPSLTLDSVNDESLLVDRLVDRLRSEGLYFTRDFVANLYVLLKSSALNLISGPPGYGKSSVVSALARALGHGNALLEIAVRRTWSDDRHVLGFFDTFHGRYDPGPTGLAPRLLQAQRDWEGDRDGIYLILLDEFNLSAPEYYFSQLLQIVSRPPEQPRTVRLFDAATLPPGAGDRVDQIALYPNVSFWGTINYDETTERLSPRLLDRTGMVFLTARDVLPADRSEVALHDYSKGVAARDVFGRWVKRTDECPEELWSRLEPIVGLLGRQSEEWGPRVEVSPRVLAAVRRYLANSRDLLPPAKAVDFVVQQRILPVLRGNGPLFVARMKSVQEKLAEGGLERSARHVQDALALAASHFGDVDFLAY
jgi:energy-coupling factor transporter ATP-binding protein EcfA2